MTDVAYRDRVEKVRAFMEDNNVDAFVVSRLPNVRYLSGFSGSSGLLLIKKDSAHFFTDFRYKEQSQQEVSRDIEIHIVKKLLEDVAGCLGDAKRVGFESRYVSYASYQELKKHIGDRELVPLPDKLLEFRAVKTEDEIQRIRRAQEITERAFEEVLQLINPDMTELDLAAELEYRMKRMGAEAPAFPTIVASGVHSALPHAKPRPVKLGANTMVVIDFGAILEGYCSDMTRTIWIGDRPDEKFVEIYNITLEAQKLAEEKACPGMKGSEVDAIARNYIKDRGYGEEFGHGLGHGVGLEVHELPRVAETSEQVLEEGMVFTIEPGIYVPGFGGVRIEDIVVMRKDGVEVITKSNKELIRI